MKDINLKEIIENCLNCDIDVPVNFVTELYQTSLSILYNQGTIIKKVEEKIGKEDFNTLFSSITASFLTTLYANAVLNQVDEYSDDEEVKKSEEDIDGEC